MTELLTAAQLRAIEPAPTHSGGGTGLGPVGRPRPGVGGTLPTDTTTTAA